MDDERPWAATRSHPPPHRWEREYAYDRESHFARLDRALELAPKNGWVVVSIKDAWSQVFPAAP